MGSGKMQHQKQTMRDVQWTQDVNSITIKTTIKRTILKKIDVVMANCVVKVSCAEKNMVKIFDLADKIDWQSKKNTIKYINDTLEVYCLKEKKAIWDDLLYNCPTRQELNERRKISLDQRDEHIRQQSKYVDDLKAKHDTLSTTERMAIDDKSRALTIQRKEEEKSQALKMIYGKDFVNKLDDIREGDLDEDQYEEIKEVEKLMTPSTTQVSYVEADKENYNEQQIMANNKTSYQTNKASKKGNEIWDEE